MKAIITDVKHRTEGIATILYDGACEFVSTPGCILNFQNGGYLGLWYPGIITKIKD